MASAESIDRDLVAGGNLEREEAQPCYEVIVAPEPPARMMLSDPLLMQAERDIEVLG